MTKYLFSLLALMLLPTEVLSETIPSSARSRKAISKVTPVLQSSLAKKGFSLGNHVFIRIIKENGRLEVFLEKDKKFKLFRSYPICNFSGDLGPKQQRGDRQAPEGFYFVRPSQLNPYSSYHLSFNLGYPNAYDRAHGRTGSALMVHGACLSIGCYAMTDARIEEIYTLMDAAYRNKQSYIRVHIFPFSMNDRNLKLNQTYPWKDFWANLKTGYDHFEKHKRPPNVLVRDKKYIFEKG